MFAQDLLMFRIYIRTEIMKVIALHLSALPLVVTLATGSFLT